MCIVRSPDCAVVDWGASVKTTAAVTNAARTVLAICNLLCHLVRASRGSALALKMSGVGADVKTKPYAGETA